MAQKKQIVVRDVWQHNLDFEFSLINKSLPQFRYASIDTEFPGIVLRTAGREVHSSCLSLQEHYFIMKMNVDVTNIIQLGITLSDENGNLPSFGRPDFQYVWQFNFRDFDVDTDVQNPESISLLKSQGIDFLKNKTMGIHSCCFAWMFLVSGLGRGLMAFQPVAPAAWVTFHGQHDFGFLIKILTRSYLPDDVATFMRLVEIVFGGSVYDLKMMARDMGLHGGLERVAKGLNVDRVAGESHQAGPDSLLTMQAFMELKKRFKIRATKNMEEHNYVLYGLTAV